VFYCRLWDSMVSAASPDRVGTRAYLGACSCPHPTVKMYTKIEILLIFGHIWTCRPKSEMYTRRGPFHISKHAPRDTNLEQSATWPANTWHQLATNILKHYWKHVCFTRPLRFVTFIYKRLRNTRTYLLTYHKRKSSGRMLQCVWSRAMLRLIGQKIRPRFTAPKLSAPSHLCTNSSQAETGTWYLRVSTFYRQVCVSWRYRPNPPTAIKTRSSAIAGRPCDAKACQG